MNGERGTSNMQTLPIQVVNSSFYHSVEFHISLSLYIYIEYNAS